LSTDKTADKLNATQLDKFCPILKTKCRADCEFFVRAKITTFMSNPIKAYCSMPHER